jgi:hypothetical protein
MRRLVAILFLLGVSFAGYWMLSQWQARDLVATQRSRLHELTATAAFLEGARNIDDWDSSVFLSARLIDRLLDELEGATLTIPSQPDVQIRVESVGFAPTAGASRVELTLRASHPSVPGELQFDAEAFLLLSAFVDEGDERLAEFHVAALRVKPALGFREFRAQLGGGISTILSSQVVGALGDQLVIRAPLQLMREIPVSLDEIKEFDADNGDVKIPVQFSAATKIKFPLFVGVPIHTSEGIWLAATRDDSTKAQRPLNVADADLVTEIARYEEKVRQLLPALPRVAADLRARIGKSALNRFVASIASLPLSERSIHVHTSGSTGEIVDEGIAFSAKLGSGGGTIALSGLNLQWAAAGAVFAAEVDIEASVEFKYKVLGIKDSSTVNAETKIAATLTPQLVTTASGVAFGVGLACGTSNIEAVTGGEVEVGVRLPFVFGDRPIAPTMIVTGVAQPLPIIRPSSLKDHLDIKLIHPYQAIVVERFSIAGDATGYQAETTIRVESSSKPFEKAQRDAQLEAAKKTIRAAWNKEMAKTCGEPGHWKLLLGGHDFGPNNVIYKLFSKVAEAGKQIAESAKIVKDQIVRIVKDPGQIDDVAKETVERTEDELKRSGKKLERETKRIVEDIKDAGKKIDRERRRILKKL